MLNKKSGLLGISGISGDMREIVAAMKNGNERARLAFDIFVHRLQTGIGAMIAALGGIDALVFTAGIGEHSAEVRAAACAKRSNPAQSKAWCLIQRMFVLRSLAGWGWRSVGSQRIRIDTSMASLK